MKWLQELGLIPPSTGDLPLDEVLGFEGSQGPPPHHHLVNKIGAGFSRKILSFFVIHKSYYA